MVTSDPLELPGITYVPLFTYEAMLAVANQHALAGKSYIVPEDLLTETLITYPVERDRLDIFTVSSEVRTWAGSTSAGSRKRVKMSRRSRSTG